MVYSWFELLKFKFYSMNELTAAALILNTADIETSKFDIKPRENFRDLSNFWKLDTPICDTDNNMFRDSEWYYMAWRVNDKTIKKCIAFMSQEYGLARKARKIFSTYMEQDENQRAHIMREAIYKKFDNNLRLQELLYTTWDRDIIEYTYRNDDLFWIDQKFKVGRNILGKLLVEYRDLFLR